jgi:hypothetical protein
MPCRLRYHESSRGASVLGLCVPLACRQRRSLDILARVLLVSQCADPSPCQPQLIVRVARLSGNVRQSNHVPTRSQVTRRSGGRGPAKHGLPRPRTTGRRPAFQRLVAGASSSDSEQGRVCHQAGIAGSSAGTKQWVTSFWSRSAIGPVFVRLWAPGDSGAVRAFRLDASPS